MWQMSVGILQDSALDLGVFKKAFLGLELYQKF